MSDDRAHLRADCSRCSALCCVAPTFAASADFLIDKPGGVACPNLRADFRCGVHERLRDSGFRGCVVFDCFGAGQQVTQVTFGGRTWRDDDATVVFDAFGVMRQLHEMLWYLAEAHTLNPGKDVTGARTRVQELTARSAEALADVDVPALRRAVGAILDRVSSTVRSSYVATSADHRGARMFGADLRGTDLRGSTLRGAYLIGANLTGADLRWTDLLGADLRDADVRAADLSTSLFLTVPQLRAARGDVRTALPAHVERPEAWGVA